MAKPSFEARCKGCGAPTVVPRASAERARKEVGPDATFSWACRCGDFVTATIVELQKEPKPLRRGRGRRRSQLAKRLADRWAKTARARPCAACSAVTDWSKGIVVQGHHIVRAALLEARAKEEGWTEEERDRRLYDLRNMLPLCEDCHRRHHSGRARLSWKLVLQHAPRVAQFAREVGLTRRATREYTTAS